MSESFRGRTDSMNDAAGCDRSNRRRRGGLPTTTEQKENQEMRVVVDLERCKGHGQCEDVAPEVFRINDAGLADVLIENPDESLRSKVELAVRLCPEECISLE